MAGGSQGHGIHQPRPSLRHRWKRIVASQQLIQFCVGLTDFDDTLCRFLLFWEEQLGGTMIGFCRYEFDVDLLKKNGQN